MSSREDYPTIPHPPGAHLPLCGVGQYVLDQVPELVAVQTGGLPQVELLHERRQLHVTACLIESGGGLYGEGRPCGLGYKGSRQADVLGG